MCVVQKLLHHLLDWLDYTNYPLLPLSLFSALQDRMIRLEAQYKGLREVHEAAIAPIIDLIFNVAIGRNGQIYFVQLN